MRRNKIWSCLLYLTIIPYRFFLLKNQLVNKLNKKTPTSSVFDYSNFSVHIVCARAERKRVSKRKSKKKSLIIRSVRSLQLVVTLGQLGNGENKRGVRRRQMKKNIFTSQCSLAPADTTKTMESKKKKIVKNQRLITWEVFIARKREAKMRTRKRVRHGDG